MEKSQGQYSEAGPKDHWRLPMLVMPLSFFLLEVFSSFFLSAAESAGGQPDLWPLAFGVAWALILTGILRLLPALISRILFGLTYFLSLSYAAVQTGYYLLFREMMWISDFRYASEGSDYFDVLLSYPASWWLGLAALAALGVLILWKYPRPPRRWSGRILAAASAAAGISLTLALPRMAFANDKTIQYARSDYGRAQSAQVAYENMFNAHRLYQVCGLYQTAVKDIYTNFLYPITPSYRQQQEEAAQTIDAYFAAREDGGENEMTGLLKGKNVILVLMESMDDWMIGEHTPTLERMMAEGIQFTRFYTPGYGGIRTFNTEFCANTGSYLRSGGGYAFDYVTNTFDQSLASRMEQAGYSALTFHYNDPSFYSRGVFSQAMGYESYVSYQDYVEEGSKALYDDQLLFDVPELADRFFREGPRLNFLITRSAHLSYKYNEVLSHWGLKKYPEYKGLTGNEETDCAYLKARLVDDLFARLLQELEDRGQLQNTVIIGITDHYTYGYKDTSSLLRLSGVSDPLLLERTPCFIWGADVPAMEVSKVLNTADLLPTMLNLLGIESPYPYMGRDAFDPAYDGFVPFSDGSWIWGGYAYSAGQKTFLDLEGQGGSPTQQQREALSERVQEFIRINNLILDTDYYAQ